MRQVQSDFNFQTLHCLPKALTHKTGFLIIELSKQFQYFVEQRLMPVQLTLKQFTVLISLDEIGPVSQQRLSDILGIDRTSMGYVIDELEKKKLIERKKQPEDRRAYAVVITGVGKTILKKAISLADLAQKKFLASLDCEEKKTTQIILHKLFLNAQDSQ